MTALIIGCSNAKEIAKKLAKEPGAKFAKSEMRTFPDGETKLVLYDDLKGEDVIIVQSGLPNSNKSIMEVCQAADIAKHHKANSIIAVFTYLPYGRQDKRIYKKDQKGKQPNTRKIVSKMLMQSGVQLLVVLDEHAADDFGKYKINKLKAVNIPCGKYLVEYLVEKYEELNFDNLILVAPDAGALPRVKQIIDVLEKKHGKIDMTNLIKERDSNGDLEMVDLKGMSPKDRDLIIVDDMICTGGTMLEAVKMLRNNGAGKIYAVATHGIFAPKDGDLNDSKVTGKMTDTLDDCVVTDSLQTDLSKVSVVPAIKKALEEIY
jgi:ribose-phosphate pyrophosphokinase|tara:strand:- start:991 stop:1947 length:957 start_codon:yes stop_codon:yes gene_type:complete